MNVATAWARRYTSISVIGRSHSAPALCGRALGEQRVEALHVRSDQPSHRLARTERRRLIEQALDGLPVLQTLKIQSLPRLLPAPIAHELSRPSGPK
jgi:hypothetical protein